MLYMKLEEIEVGTTFDTKYEQGLRVASWPPDEYTQSFDCYDSDGVLCSCSVQMIEGLEIEGLES